MLDKIFITFHLMPWKSAIKKWKLNLKPFDWFVFLFYVSGGFAQNKDFHPWCLALIHGAVFIHECSLNGKLFRLSIMYELITCFHVFCNYEDTKKITKFYFFTFLQGKFLDVYQTVLTVYAKKKRHFANFAAFMIRL